MKAISGMRELDTLLRSKNALVLKFSATWCGPCRAFAPFMDKLDAQYPGVAMYEVDLDANQDIAQQYTVTAVPTVILFKKGQEFGRVRGGDTAQVSSLVQQLAGSTANTISSYGKGYTLYDGASSKSSKKGVAIPAAVGSYRIFMWIKLYLATLLSFNAREVAKSMLAAQET